MFSWSRCLACSWSTEVGVGQFASDRDAVTNLLRNAMDLNLRGDKGLKEKAQWRCKGMIVENPNPYIYIDIYIYLRIYTYISLSLYIYIYI